MAELFIRVGIWVVLAVIAVWFCNKWLKERQAVAVRRCRRKWNRLSTKPDFDGSGIARDRLESRRLNKLGRAIFIPIVLLLTAYLCNFAFKPPSPNPEEWGQMGDFFGGMLNPILAFASFFLLLYTIRIQLEELRLTRTELKNSVEAQQAIASNSEDQLILLIYQQSTDMLNSYRSSIHSIYKKTKNRTPSGQPPQDLHYYINNIRLELGNVARLQQPTVSIDRLWRISAQHDFAQLLAREVCAVLPGVIAELNSQSQLLERSDSVKSLMHGRFYSVYTGVVHEYARMLLFFRMTPQKIGRQDSEIAFEQKIIEDAIRHLSEIYLEGKTLES